MQLNLDGGSITTGTGGSEQPIDAQIGEAIRKMITKEINGVLLHTFHPVIGEPSGAGNSSGSEQLNNSDYAKSGEALRNMIKKEIEVVVIRTFHQQPGWPFAGDLMRKVVKEEIQSAFGKFFIGENQNYEHEIGLSVERTLQLKFLNEVSAEVLTAKQIKGKEDTPIGVALVDPITGLVVKSGSEASAKVEILVLESSSDDNEKEFSMEDFNNKIIRESDKKKPHFTKNKYIYLKEGVGVLYDVKLAHDSGWMRSCQCRLGARNVKNFSGIKVKEAWTEPFKVSDSRSKLYEKHYPPQLCDDVWRLLNIGKDGPRYKRLTKEKISTVQDFLFLLRIDPQRLKKIVGAGAKMWKATVDHAQTCIIDDYKIYLYCPSSFELKQGVTFNAVGQLKGIIRDSHYIQVTSLPENETACAHKLLLSAFDNGKDIVSFDDETSLLHQLLYPSSGVSATTNYSSLEDPSGSDDLTVCRNINGYNPTEPGTSSYNNSSSVVYPDNLCQFGESNLRNHNDDTSCPFSDEEFLKQFSGNEWVMALILSEENNVSGTLRSGSHSRHQSKGCSTLVRVVTVMLWYFRAKKRVKALDDVRISKRQKIH